MVKSISRIKCYLCNTTLRNLIMKNIYFLSGLPRSGSTVLAAILSQNPEVHTTATSGLLDMLVGTLRAWADSMSVQATPDKAKAEAEIQRILRNICESKYEDVDKPIILDKARGWASDVNIPTMAKVLGHKPKIIATVRSIPDCVASMVRVAKPENLDEFLRESELVSHVKESYQVLESGYRFAPECILFVEYDDLLSDPQKELDRIHAFLEIQPHTYDLSAINADHLKENDKDVWQVEGLHDVKPKLERQHKDTAEDVLGVFYRDYQQPRFWRGESAGHRPLHDLDLQLSASLMGNFEEGWQLAQKIEKDEPWNHRAAFNRGWYKMWKNELLEGEKLLFRGRIEKVFGNDPPQSPTPMWDGKTKGTILLNLEGGLGDQMHGLRYVREIKKRGCDVIVACSGPLALIARQVEGVLAVVQHEAVFGVVHDAWVPSMSAVPILEMEYKDVDGSPYIPQLAVKKGSKYRIGIRWQGNPQFEHEQHRLFPSHLLFDAIKDLDVEIISLQRDEGAQHRPHWIKQVPLNSWEDTQAAISSCDLVISSCTSVAHMAASMGVETWIVVPILPYYLWAKTGDTTPWYNSVKLFRQTSFGDWGDPFRKIKAQLSAFNSAKAA